MGPSLLASYFPELQTRSKMLGWGSTTGNIVGIVLSVGTGYLAATSIRFFWLVNLVMLIPLVAAILMPEPKIVRGDVVKKFTNMEPLPMRDR